MWVRFQKLLHPSDLRFKNLVTMNWYKIDSIECPGQDKNFRKHFLYN